MKEPFDLVGGQELPRFRYEHRSDLDMRPPADRAPEPLFDGIFDNVIVLILVGTQKTNSGRDAPAEKTVHHHVRVFGIYPQTYAVNAINRTSLVPDEQALLFLELVTDRGKRERSAHWGRGTCSHGRSLRRARFRAIPEHIDEQFAIRAGFELILQPIGSDEQLRVFKGAVCEPVEQIVQAHLHDLDILVVETAALRPQVGVAHFGEIKKYALGGASRR